MRFENFRLGVPAFRNAGSIGAKCGGDLQSGDPPLNMAEEASAISSASPAACTGMPASLGLAGELIDRI